MSNKIAKITYLLRSSWEGIYLDGELFAEGRSIRDEDYQALAKHLLSEGYDDAQFGSSIEIEDYEFWDTHLGRCPKDWISVLRYGP